MTLLKRTLFAGLVGLLCGTAAAAQGWGAGASLGVVNDVGRRFHLDEFKPKDVNLFGEFRLEENVVLRGTFGSLRVKGENAGLQVSLSPGAPPTELPDLTSKIDYGTIGVSYEFWEGEYTSGLFAGIGGYKIRPEPVAPVFENFRDLRETAFGWHIGADASVRIVSRAALLARLTYHKIRSDSGRSILTANAGILYRF